MSYKVFIPVTDEILYEYPELINGPLRPYQVDSPCFHWMATVESEDKKTGIKSSKKFDHTMLLNSTNHSEHTHTNSRLA